MGKRPLCLAALIFAAGMFLLLKLWPIPIYDNPVIDGEKIEITGKVEKKQFKNDKSVIYLSHVFVDGIPQSQDQLQQQDQTQQQPGPQQPSLSRPDYADRDGKLGAVLYTDGGFLPPVGAYVRASGKARLFESPGNPGQFDQGGYYRIQKIDFMLQNARILRCSADFSRFREQLFIVQQKVSGLYDLLLDKNDAGVIKAMLLGNKESLDPELSELYQRNGISHILAISGLHVSIIGMGLYRILRKAGCPYAAAGLAGGSFMVCFCVMTGGSASTVRAVTMYLVCVLAGCLGRTYDMLTALSLSAVLLLLEQPYYLEHSGFLLSFGAVLGIGILYPVLRELFPCRISILNKLVQAFLSGLSVTIMTLPVVLYYYYQLPVYASFLNLFIIPLMGGVLLTGLLCGGAGMVSLFAGKMAAAPCRLLLLLYEKSCRLCDSLPAPLWMPGQPSAPGICVYYAILAVGLLIWYGRRKQREERGEREQRKQSEEREQREQSEERGERQGNPQKERNEMIRRAAPCALLLFMALALTFHREPPFSVTILDVGQGDGICIRAGKRFTCLIDGGSSDVQNVGKYRLQPYLKSRGIRKVDYAFVSHTDQDHINGLKELLLMQGQGGVRIGALVLPAIGNPDEAYLELTDMARASGTKVFSMERGDCVGAGGMMLTCLFPEKGMTVEDKNDASMVLEISYGQLRGLFMGDLGEEGEKEILMDAMCGEHESHVFLKAGHHGSNTSNSEQFLQSMKFGLAFVSCGKDNRYGHPGKQTMERFAKNHIRSFLTYRDGALSFETDGRSGRLSGYRSGKIELDLGQ